MQCDYTYFKKSELTSEVYLDIIQNAVGCLRGHGREIPRHASASLFQAVAFFERLTVMESLGKRESPPRTLTDEELYTQDFANRLEIATDEFKTAERSLITLMSSVHSIASPLGLLASCFLNPMLNLRRETLMDAKKSRVVVCEHALPLFLGYSQVPWTHEMYDNLMAWYPPALLLCAENNIPTMCTPAVRIAIDWAMSLDEKPTRRFKTMRDQFENMIGSREPPPHLDLPEDFVLN